MAQVNLNTLERNKLVAILARHIGINAVERQNTLNAAGLATLSHRFDFQQPSNIFAGSLIDGLQKRGTLRETGKPALVNILQWLANNEDVEGDEDESEVVAVLLARPYVRANEPVTTQPEPAVTPPPSPYLKPPTPDQQFLLNIMLNPNNPPPQRAEAGRRLADIGDPRRGVGVDDNGIPDIDWVEIPDDGEFIYGLDMPWLDLASIKLHLPLFAIARYPITYKQFQAFLDAKDGFNDTLWWHGLDKGDLVEQQFKVWNHPRENVMWYQAVGFCRWLSARMGYEITLPTQQQWEKAARGKDGRIFPWNEDKYKIGYANINEVNELNHEKGSYYLKQTSTVGIYPQGASPYGVQDMIGNVLEWTSSIDSGDSSYCVSRGSSWDLKSTSAPAYMQFSIPPKFISNYMGFRVAGNSPF